MMHVNIKSMKKCAFCKYWYDPTNSSIMPESPNINLWKILDGFQKRKCIKRNVDMPACGSCKQYCCKL